MGDIEIGQCDTCRKPNRQVQRKRYYYALPCECCTGNRHFMIRYYCNTCEPTEAEIIKPLLKTEKINRILWGAW